MMEFYNPIHVPKTKERIFEKKVIVRNIELFWSKPSEFQLIFVLNPVYFFIFFNFVEVEKAVLLL